LKRCLLIPALLLAFASTASAQTTAAILDSVQRTAFQYFWYQANPANGLVRDRSTSGSPASIAAVGFGLSSICVAVDHGWVTRADARTRVLTTLQTFWNGPQGSASSGTIGYRGLFYHWLDMNTATRSIPFNSELSTIDTALLFAGILDAKQYFQTSDPGEVQIRELADSIYRRADWNFARNNHAAIQMGWRPGTGFANFGEWIGYNEAMILYILALGSPTHPLPDTTATGSWAAWTSGYQWDTQYGYSFVIFPPLFGHQYSHCWIDFRTNGDEYMRGHNITYYENSRRATLAQRAYSIANPGGFVGYSDSLWGITASDVPSGYNARGAPPAQNDDGTITPTAAISSIPFAPDEVIPVVRNLYLHYKPQLWGPYGFRDAFNPTVNWYDTDVLGIDQGPIAMMIENYLNQSIWNRFMQNADIQRGLQRAGFFTTVGVEPGSPAAARLELYAPVPDPFRGSTLLRYRTAAAGRVRVVVFDLAGRQVARLVDTDQPAGPHEVTFAAHGLPSGIYQVRLEGNGSVATRRCVLLQ
jgi:hypothetical protein